MGKMGTESGVKKLANCSETEDGDSPLPEELVEKIVSMMSYPSILKARMLNKSWNLRLSASSLEYAGFQEEVKSVSSKWSHYCPVILNKEEDWLLGFDRKQNRWLKLVLGFECSSTGSVWYQTQKLRGAGSLMCGVFDRHRIFVTSLVTRAWKWLPPRPNMDEPKEIHLALDGADAYKVLVITPQKRSCKVSAQVYESRSNAWTVTRSTVSSYLSFNSSSVFLGGVMYVMQYDPDDSSDFMKLLAYNVKDGVWTTIPHPFACMLHTIETYELLICQRQPMVVIHVTPRSSVSRAHSSTLTLRNTLIVFRLDPVSLEIREVSRGPPETLTGAMSTLFTSDDDCIYFGDPQVERSSVVVFNVTDRRWSCIPPPPCTDGSYKNKWMTFAFEPGLNPFVSV